MTTGTGDSSLGCCSGPASNETAGVIGWSELREMTLMAEAVGFDTIWVADHLIYRDAGSVVMEPGTSRGPHEVWTLLSAIASITSRVTLGPFVACTSFREPALLAKMADTLDEVSGGRLLLGLGAGYHVPEYTAFGYPHDHLASRFEEALQIILPLLKGERVTFHGHVLQRRRLRAGPPRPAPGGPPIWIGARQPRMLRLVARYADAYNTLAPRPGDRHGPVQPARRRLRGGRPRPGTIQRTSGTHVLVTGAGDAPDWPPNAITGSTQQIADELWRFKTEGGASHVSIILDPWTTRGIEQFGRVIEALRAR